MAYNYKRLLENLMVGVVSGCIAGLILLLGDTFFKSYCNKVLFIVTFAIIVLIILVFVSILFNFKKSKSKK